MAAQRRYPSLTSEASRSPLRIVVILIVVFLLVFFIYGAKQVFNELKSISEGQQELILKLTANDIQQPIADEDQLEAVKGEYISKVEFIKFRNETNKSIRDMAKELRLIKTKLRMKQTVLDKY